MHSLICRLLRDYSASIEPITLMRPPSLLPPLMSLLMPLSLPKQWMPISMSHNYQQLINLCNHSPLPPLMDYSIKMEEVSAKQPIISEINRTLANKSVEFMWLQLHPSILIPSCLQHPYLVV